MKRKSERDNDVTLWQGAARDQYLRPLQWTNAVLQGTWPIQLNPPHRNILKQQRISWRVNACVRAHLHYYLYSNIYQGFF